VIERREAAERIARALRRQRVVVLVGPRQCGKTTLARQIVNPASSTYFDLENPNDLRRLEEPMTALSGLSGTVVIDEVQRRPDLFPALRVLADRTPRKARFLILGSAAPELLRQSSETLAGRAEVVTLPGLSLTEVGTKHIERHWRRGGYPRAFLARSEADSTQWRHDLIQTFVERDAPLLGPSIPPPALLRFWTMVAHWHGGIWNSADPARSLGTSESTARRYLDFMTGALMLRQLQPWHENLAKRQVKAPKVYLRDSGLLHELLGIRSDKDLWSHPKSGASWEGYALEETLKAMQPDQAYFWATHQGAELDLLIFKDGKRYGVEFKRSDAPSLTPSMRIAMNDLKLRSMVVFCPTTKPYDLAPGIRVRSLDTVTEGMDLFR
jgi:predicted AAA+ superfamily ATPase